MNLVETVLFTERGLSNAFGRLMIDDFWKYMQLIVL